MTTKVDSVGEFDGYNKLNLSIWRNNSGQCYSEDISGGKIFGTPSLNMAPLARTVSVTGITMKGAILNGEIIANHLSTNVFFEYGTLTNYNQSVRALTEKDLNKNHYA